MTSRRPNALDPLGHLPGGLEPAVGEHDLRAAPGQQARRRAADAASGAGNDHYLVLDR
jgi:hypothetical protein